DPSVPTEKHRAYTPVHECQYCICILPPSEIFVVLERFLVRRVRKDFRDPPFEQECPSHHSPHTQSCMKDQAVRVDNSLIPFCQKRHKTSRKRRASSTNWVPYRT